MQGDWTGQGLPPVGTKCEFAGGSNCADDPFDKDLKEGAPVTIIAHFKDGESDIAAFIFNPNNPNRGSACVEQGMQGCFRPIRTPEQVAAEEAEEARGDAIREMLRVWMVAPVGVEFNHAHERAAALYDAGCRLPAKP